jgi:hypothetical protein
MIVSLFAGALMAVAIFCAFLWSLYQSFTQRAKLQSAHIGAAIFTLLGMMSISMLLPLLAKISGTLLVIAALTAIILDTRWSRLLPVFQLLFAIILILNLPFAP